MLNANNKTPVGLTLNDSSLSLRLDSWNNLEQEMSYLMQLSSHYSPYSHRSGRTGAMSCSTESQADVPTSSAQGFYDTFRTFLQQNALLSQKRNYNTSQDIFMTWSGGQDTGISNLWVESQSNDLLDGKNKTLPSNSPIVPSCELKNNSHTLLPVDSRSQDHQDEVKDFVDSKTSTESLDLWGDDTTLPLVNQRFSYDEISPYLQDVAKRLSCITQDQRYILPSSQQKEKKQTDEKEHFIDALNGWGLNNESNNCNILKVQQVLPLEADQQSPRDQTTEQLCCLQESFWKSCGSSPSHHQEKTTQDPIKHTTEETIEESSYFFSPSSPRFELPLFLHDKCIGVSTALTKASLHPSYPILVNTQSSSQDTTAQFTTSNDAPLDTELNFTHHDTSDESQSIIPVMSHDPDEHYEKDPLTNYPPDLFHEDKSLRLDIFKVFPCQNAKCQEGNCFGAQHNKKTCPYYHSQRDRRRHPRLRPYKAEQCNHHFNIDTDGPLRCPYKDACHKCHNHHELLYHPLIYKQRFCSSYNQLECHRGNLCAFAHSRSDIRCELFSIQDEQNPGAEFFMNLFKTLWCPYGVQHDWHACLYAHTYQDCRRAPQIGYSSEPCPYWKKDLHSVDYDRRCPSGSRCSYAHGSKEQLYHASCYKIMPCVDYRARKLCPRGIMCAFYHEPHEKRSSTTVINPCKILPESSMKCLQKNFSKPLLFNMDGL